MTPKAIDTEVARELFDYRDGKLYWRAKASSRAMPGQEAGTVNINGYVCVTMKGKKYHAHRIVWAWHGREPAPQLDHINGCKTDNRIENLRPANHITNAYNCRRKADNKSGVKGVSWCNHYQQWVVQMYHNKKKVQKRFKQFDDAVAFANETRARLHGEFARAA